MTTPKTPPTGVQRARARFPMGAWYFDVLRGAPKAAWSALDLVATVVGIAAIVGLGTIDTTWALVAFLVLLAWYMLRLNYAKVAAMRAEFERHNKWAMGHIRTSLDRDIFTGRSDWFRTLFEDGSNLLKALANADDDDRTEWVKKVDDWVASCERMLKDAPDDLATFTAPIRAPSDATTWKEKQIEFLYVRVTRYGELWSAHTSRR